MAKKHEQIAAPKQQRFNLNGVEVEDQDILVIRSFYWGAKKTKKQGDKDQEALRLLLLGGLYPREWINHQELQDCQPSFHFVLDDVQKAINSYQKDQPYLSSVLAKLKFEEFLYRPFSVKSSIKYSAPFLFYHYIRPTLKLCESLTQEEAKILGYVIEKWYSLPNPQKIENLDSIAPIISRLNEFTALFSDLAPVQERYEIMLEDKHEVLRPWGAEDIKPVIDDFFECLSFFHLKEIPWGFLVSVKMWRKVFIQHMRYKLNLTTEDMAEYEDPSQVDHFSSSYRSFFLSAPRNKKLLSIPSYSQWEMFDGVERQEGNS